MAPSFRYEPLSPARFPIGQGPFRARGLAYVMALKYVDTRFSGGRPAFLEALGASDALAAFYDQIFLVSGEYDVSPLLRLYLVCARSEGIDIGRFIEDRARKSADSDAKGMWRPLLNASSPEHMADRTHLAFNRYFPPCQATPLAARPGHFEGRLSKLPSSMTGLYTSATAGFICAAVELAGGIAPTIEWDRSSTDGQISGVSLEKVRFTVKWTVATPPENG
ncbi:Hypothetical protein A7982_06976 [Minicystis rosea]|nr:Hypothetical protein A7982_06976 [Minicystis rosea]